MSIRDYINIVEGHTLAEADIRRRSLIGGAIATGAVGAGIGTLAVRGADRQASVGEVETWVEGLPADARERVLRSIGAPNDYRRRKKAQMAILRMPMSDDMIMNNYVQDAEKVARTKGPRF